eukprot:COSAG01_NODE_5465_length_4244_cov_54.041255_4_plen_171_part_00
MSRRWWYMTQEQVQLGVRGRVEGDLKQRRKDVFPARPFPSSILLDKNRRDIGKYQSIWTDSKMETAGSQHLREGAEAAGLAAEHLPQPRDLDHPARPFSPSIFLDKNRRDIGKSQSMWTDPKMETAGSPSHVVCRGTGAGICREHLVLHKPAPQCVPLTWRAVAILLNSS